MSDRRGSGGSNGSGGVTSGTGGNKKPSEKSYILENKRSATTKADPKQVQIINLRLLRQYCLKSAYILHIHMYLYMYVVSQFIDMKLYTRIRKQLNFGSNVFVMSKIVFMIY